MAAYLPGMSQSTDPAAAARDALTAFMRSAPADWQRTGPGLMSGVDAQKVEQGLAKAWRQIGAFVSVSGTGERLTVHGTRGTMPVWARADNSGLLSGLLLGEPLGRGASIAGKHWRARLAYPYVWWAFLLVNATVFCWLASSGLSWLGYAAVAAALGVLMYGLAIPDPLLMRRRVRLAAGAVGVTAAASAVRVVTLPAGTWWSAAVGVLFLVLAMIGLAWVRYDWPRETVQAVMIFPLAEGTWQVAVGGGRGFLNHHAAAAEQRGALDIVRACKNGARATSWFPSDVRAFAAHGCTVVAPCDGTVLRAVDAYLPRPDPVPAMARTRSREPRPHRHRHRGGPARASAPRQCPGRPRRSRPPWPGYRAGGELRKLHRTTPSHPRRTQRHRPAAALRGN